MSRVARSTGAMVTWLLVLLILLAPGGGWHGGSAGAATVPGSNLEAAANAFATGDYAKAGELANEALNQEWLTRTDAQLGWELLWRSFLNRKDTKRAKQAAKRLHELYPEYSPSTSVTAGEREQFTRWVQGGGFWHKYHWPIIATGIGIVIAVLIRGGVTDLKWDPPDHP